LSNVNLVINNTDYNAAVNWFNSDGVISASLGAGNPFEVVNAEAAELTTILGASAGGTNQLIANTLSTTATSAGSVSGSITDHKVVLSSGLDVIDPSSSAAYLNYSNDMSFDGLGLGGGVTTSYTEGSFTLSTSNLAGFARNDVISPSAQFNATTDQYTLKSAD